MKKTLIIFLALIGSITSAGPAVTQPFDCLELRKQAVHEMNRLRRLDESQSPKINGEKLLKQAAEVCLSEALAAEDPETAAALALESFLSEHRLIGRAHGRDAAKQSLYKALGKIESLHHDSSPALIPILRRLSISVTDDDPQHAVELMQRAADIAESEHGADSHELASVLSDFGFLYAPRNLPGVDKNPLEDVEKAEVYLRRSIEIFSRQDELVGHEGLIDSLGSMKALLRGEGRFEEAATFERLYNEASLSLPRARGDRPLVP